jgi:hypothetical protein
MKNAQRNSLKLVRSVWKKGGLFFSVSQSVVKQVGAAPIFTQCGRATLTPVLEYLVTEPPLKSDGTPRYAAPAAKAMLSMDPRWYCTRLMHIHQQGGYENRKM